MFFKDKLTNFIFSKQREIYKLLENTKNFNHRSDYYKIKRYIDDFLDGKSENRFIVMPGLRGLGKTTIIFQLYDYLLNEKHIDYKNMLYVSMDQIVSYFDTNLLTVVDNFLETVHKTTKVNLDKKLFIFVDESHFDEKWGISGKIIYDNTKNIFLICTGSSAIDLEINTDIVRRISKENIYPNNFRDYLSLKHNITIDSNFSKTLENMIYFGSEKYINQAINLENKIFNQLISLNNDPKIEFEKFLKSYGFPFTLKLDENESYKQIFTIVDSIIEKDIPTIKSFNSSTKDTIKRIIIYIALQKAGSTSNQKIANYLSISPTLVRDILDILEKTQLIFSIKPYGGAGKIVRKPWQYYFLSASIKASINFEIARFNLENKKCLGILAENLVASCLFKMSKTSFNLMGMFYPPEKGGVDFLLITNIDDIVPIEVGIGKKTKSQLIKSINKYDANYGILVSNRYNRIKYDNGIIYMPLLMFGFI
jgi:predicted AAA+ superfamily ATPase